MARCTRCRTKLHKPPEIGPAGRVALLCALCESPGPATVAAVLLHRRTRAELTPSPAMVRVLAGLYDDADLALVGLSAAAAEALYQAEAKRRASRPKPVMRPPGGPAFAAWPSSWPPEF